MHDIGCPLQRIRGPDDLLGQFLQEPAKLFGRLDGLVQLRTKPLYPSDTPPAPGPLGMHRKFACARRTLAFKQPGGQGRSGKCYHQHSRLAAWRNWQTQETQNLPEVTLRVGSIPSAATNEIRNFRDTAAEQERHRRLSLNIVCFLPQKLGEDGLSVLCGERPAIAGSRPPRSSVVIGNVRPSAVVIDTMRRPRTTGADAAGSSARRPSVTSSCSCDSP